MFQSKVDACINFCAVTERIVAGLHFKLH